MRRFPTRLTDWLTRYFRTEPSRLRQSSFRPVLEELETRVVPAITYHGAPLLTNVDVEALFYGAPWQDQQSPNVTPDDIGNFLSQVTDSPFMDMLTDAGYGTGRGTYLDGVIDPVDVSSGNVDDSDIQDELRADIDNGTLQPPDDNRVYMVFLPPGVGVNGNGTGGGYHGPFQLDDGSVAAYAVITIVDEPNTPWPAELNQMTNLVCHELAESVTDPVGGGWYDDNGPPGESEICDYVNGQGVFQNGYLLHIAVDQNEDPIYPDGTTFLQSLGQDVATGTGQQFQQTVAIFQDVDLSNSVDDFSATIDFGDGQTADGQIVDNGDGTYGVVATHTYTQVGSYDINVQITDNNDGDTTSSDSNAVVGAALGASGQDVTAYANQEFNGTVATFLDGDGTGTAADYSAQIDFGDGQTADGQIVDNGDGTFSIEGTNTYAQVGTYTVQVQLTDNGDGDTADASSTATVLPTPDLTAQGQDLQATAGQQASATVATFSDPDASGSLADYSASIDFGDGQTADGQIVDNGDGTFSVTGSNTYARIGSYTIQVQINDGFDGDSALVSSTATVAPGDDLSVQGQDITATVGQPFSGTVATISDPDASGSLSDYSAQIDWGDGQTSAGQIVDNGDGTFSVQGTNTYAQLGFYTVSVQVNDASDGNTAGANLTAAALPASTNLPAGGQAIAATAGQPFTGTITTFTDGDNLGTADGYSATISWGDGQVSTGQVLANGEGTFYVVGTHTYAQAGSNTIQVLITEGDGDAGVATSSATVLGGGTATFVNQMSGVAYDLTHSNEYYTDLINAAYEQYLQRAPDPGGLAYWKSSLEHGLSDEHLEASFFSSPEFINDNGGLGTTWIQAVYQDELGRAADPGGLAYFQGQLGQGVSAATITFQFATSPEREGQRVGADYVRYLGRLLDPSGKTYWVNQFENHGASNEDVVAGFVGSIEFYQKHGHSYTSWLVNAYEATLDRAPTQAEIATWLAAL